jgi:hypothetical protein
MLLFIIMNMSNYRVYFMRQSASAPGGKVSAPRSVPRAHCDTSAPITGRPRHVICSPRPLAFRPRPDALCPRPVTFHPHVQEQVRAHSHSARAYRKKSAPAACGRRMPGSSIKGRVPQLERQPFPSASRPGTQH